MCDTPKHIQPAPSTLEALRLVLSSCGEFATPQRFAALLAAVAPDRCPAPERAASAEQRADLAIETLITAWQGEQNLLQALLRRVAAGCPAQDQRCRALRALDRRLTAELEVSGEAAWRRGERYLARLDQHPTAGLLAEYLAELRPVGHHEQIEWRLTELALEMPLEDLALEQAQPGLADRPSGAALLWALGQRLRRPGPPPDRLTGAPLAAWQAGVVVRAWALWPDNPCFREEALCARLADWLAGCGHSLVPLVPQLIAAGHTALAAACVRRDGCAATYGATLEAALALLDQPTCWDEGRRLLGSMIIAAARQPEQLRALARIAFAQGCYNEVISVVMLLTRQGAADQELLAWRIAAWAALGRYGRAAELYAAAWPDRPDAPPFPYPRQLLPALRTPDTAAPRRRLLRSADLDLLDERQRLEALAARGQAEHTLGAWARLLYRQLGALSGADLRAALTEDSDSLDLLLQLTEACLQSRPDRPERLYATTLWQSLRDDDRLAVLSAAAHTLLEPDDKRCAEVYEHWMPPEVPPDAVAAHWARRATQRYLEALAQQRRWGDARRFLEEPRTQQLLGQIAPDEQRYWRLLHDLEQALAENPRAQEHGRLWERTLCLDLPDRYVCLLVEHFASRRPLGHPEEQERLDDLALHIERRGKALGERLLAELPRVCDHHVHTHLADSDLHALGRLLHHLTHHPEECYDCAHHAGDHADHRDRSGVSGHDDLEARQLGAW